MNENNYCPMLKLAYAYVLPQTFSKTYSPEEALDVGTLFPELDIPLEIYVPKNEMGGYEYD